MKIQALTKCLILFLMIGLVGPLVESAHAQKGEQAATPSPQQAQEDAEQLLALYEQYQEAFEGIYGGSAVGETSLAGSDPRRFGHNWSSSNKRCCPPCNHLWSSLPRPMVRSRATLTGH